MLVFSLSGNDKVYCFVVDVVVVVTPVTFSISLRIELDR